MASVEHRVQISRPAGEVWAILGDFWGLAAWFPGIEACEKTSDDIRTIQMGNLAIEEQLLDRSDDGRSLAYTIKSGPMPLEFHRAEWSVAPDGDDSVLTVRAEVRPDVAMDLMGPVYEQAAQGLKQHIER